MIWNYSFNYKTYWGPWSQKKEDMKPSTSHSMSRLKFKILFDHPNIWPLHFSPIGFYTINVCISMMIPIGNECKVQIVCIDYSATSMSRLKFKILFDHPNIWPLHFSPIGFYTINVCISMMIPIGNECKVQISRMYWL